jgi:hypothetical protein
MPTDSSASGDDTMPAGQMVMSALIAVVLMLLLILTGLKITQKDIREVNLKSAGSWASASFSSSSSSSARSSARSCAASWS